MKRILVENYAGAVLLVGCLLGHAEVVAEPATSIVARYERAAATKNALGNKWLLNQRVSPRWIGESDRFWYKRQTRDGSLYVVVDAQTGRSSTAFDHAGLAASLAAKVGKPVKPEALNLIGLSLEADGTMQFDAFDKRWRYTADQNLVELGPTLTDLNISPNRKLGLFSKERNLWIKDLVTGKETQLTFDGEIYYEYGQAPASALMPRPGPKVVWSPDSTRIFTVQTDDRKVLNSPVIDYAPTEGLRPKIVEYRNAYPGDANVTTYRPVIIDIETKRQTAVRYPVISAVRQNEENPVDYNRVWWKADGREVYFLDIERGERAVHLVATDASNGSTRTLFSETSDRPINVGTDYSAPTDIVYLTQSNQLILYSERSGTAHYYLYDLNSGKLLRAITSGLGVARGILGVDEPRRSVFVSMAGRVPGRNPYYREVLRVNLDRPGFKVVSGSDADHAVARPTLQRDREVTSFVVNGGDRYQSSGLSPSGNFFVETQSRVDRPGETYVIDREGKQIARIEVADTSNAPANFNWPTAVQLLAADGKTSISAFVVKPPNYDPRHKYPIVDLIYGGPQISWVPKAMGDPYYYDALAFAELGFVTVIIDGRGTAWRERSFSQSSFGHISNVESLEDHIGALRQLAAKDPGMDLDRVGIYGFSNGGFMTVNAMLRFPDFFKVGVAGNGNYDQRLYWHAWGERFQGYPVDDDEYKRQASMFDVSSLKGKLLLFHGGIDRGVHPSGFYQLVQALRDANKDFDMFVEPRLLHEFSDYEWRRTWDYFVQNLLGEEPPKQFLLTSPKINRDGEILTESKTESAERKLN